MRSIYSLLFLLITLGLSSCSEKKPTLREQSFDEEWLFYRGDIVEGERSAHDMKFVKKLYLRSLEK